MLINKLPVKKLVEFRRLSERSKSTFANNLKTPNTPKSDDSSGGNYWVRSISGVSSAFKANDNKLIQEKINDVVSKDETTKKESTKMMYKRNLEILHNYIDFDFSIWRPPTKLQYLTKSKLFLTVKDIPIQVIPNHVFLFNYKEELTVGGIWFVIWLDKFKSSDLGIYSESLFQYLTFVYSKKYKVSPDYCLVVDLLTGNVVNYNQILEGEISSLLESTIDMVKRYL